MKLKNLLKEVMGLTIDENLPNAVKNLESFTNDYQDKVREYKENLEDEYVGKLNTTYRSELKDLIGNVITEEDAKNMKPIGQGILVYRPKGGLSSYRLMDATPDMGILNSPIVSASYVVTDIRSSENINFRLLLKLENGKEFELKRF